MEPIELPVPADGCIMFFKRDREAFGFLSNFFDAPIVLDGEEWRSTEFYYQAQKSRSPEYRGAIRAAEGPGHAKALGTDPAASKRAERRSWFRGRAGLMRSDWAEAKLAVMEKAVRAKFAQNPELAARLVATGGARIVEDSAYDSFWGVGADGNGENWLGRILMRVREELRLQG